MKTTTRKQSVSFDASIAFQNLVDQVSALTFQVEQLQRALNVATTNHQALKEGYIKHVHKSHLAIEARLAFVERPEAEYLR